ncbi:hypothetical protein JPSP45_24180 [Staphylococcus pseudintermedius]
MIIALKLQWLYRDILRIPIQTLSYKITDITGMISVIWSLPIQG